MKIVITDSSKGHLRSLKVTNRFCLYQLTIERDTDLGMVLTRLSRRGRLTNMKHGLLGPPRDLDLKSNFPLDLSMSIDIQLALLRETRWCKIDFLPFLYKNVFFNIFEQYDRFDLDDQ